MNRFRKLYLKLNFRERALLFVSSILVSCLLVKLFVFDEYSQMASLGRQIDDLSSQIEQSQNSLIQLQNAKNEMTANAALLAYKKENVGQAGLMKVLSETEKKNNGFALRKIASEKNEKLDEVEKNTFQMEVEAPFISIGSFLENLENSKLLTRVDSVQVFRTEKELSLCRAKIIVDSYSWREP